MTRKLIKSGLCAGALAFGAVCVYGETFSLPEGTQRCADGSCVPRRVTNGYYPTQWRRWPVSEPAAPQPGVREGIPAPPVELPPPREETDLPQGALTAPGPGEDYGGAPDYGTAPRGTPPVTQPPLNPPPAGRTVPRTGPQPPPELFRDMPRSTPDSRTPRFPMDNRSPRNTPSIASRRSHRPANVVEELRDEARGRRAFETQHGDFSAPAALPDDAASAEPLEQAASAERTSFQSSTQWRPASDRQAAVTNPMREEAAGVPWSPSRSISEIASAVTANEVAEPTRPHWSAGEAGTSTQDGLGPRLQALRAANDAFESGHGLPSEEAVQSSESPIRPEAASPNTAAAVGLRPNSANVQRASATAELTISAPASSTVFTVRSGSDDNWQHGSAINNPLRDRDSTVTKVRWESGDSAVEKSELGKPNSEGASKNASSSTSTISPKRVTNAPSSQTAATVVSSEEDIPRNPLR